MWDLNMVRSMRILPVCLLPACSRRSRAVSGAYNDSHPRSAPRPGQGAISNAGGLRSFRQAVSGAVGVSKKETVMACAHFDAAKTTWAS